MAFWSFGRVTLRLSEAEFWGLTPAQYVALVERWRRDRDAENEAEDYRAALITSTILNTIPRTKATQHKVYQPWDIFPNYNWHGTQQTMTPDQFLQAWQGYGDVKIVELN